MKWKESIKLSCRILILIILIVLPVSSDELKIITYPKSDGQYAYGMSIKEVRFLFSMKNLYWDNGEKVTVILLPWNSQAHKTFVRRILGVSPSRLRAVIEARINAGDATKYIKVNNFDDMIERVSTIEGAIGYTSKHMIIGRGNEIQIININ